ncbi:endonuclease/exonuclease/phosphatase family protein [Paenibacillus turpanensis]|uniref:endonuclease/exonuclease/phosphatase family protein n=1 Tax=Paenibacillus turpanensis TaxID=2689078 RepID=UPI00140E85AB|nr:endonuclease/exonuclease/phosphatase family protein [Paenibacillus turpanensis]
MSGLETQRKAEQTLQPDASRVNIKQVTAEAASLELKVASFNLRRNVWFDGWNMWPLRRKRVLEWFRANEPDLVGVQELLPSMRADLERSLKSYTCIGEARDGGGRDESCPILYRKMGWRRRKTGTFWLSETPEQPGSKSWDAAYPRICSWCELEASLPDGGSKRLRLYNTHLDHAGPEARLHGAAVIGEQIARHHKEEPLPFVWTGDFNATFGSRPIDYITVTMEEQTGLRVRDVYSLAGGSALEMPTAEEPGRTFHGYRGGVNGWPIDFIFISDDIMVEHVEVDRTRFGWFYPSDHYPVLTRLRL